MMIEEFLGFFEDKTPRPGLEPGTKRLTAVRSTIELSRNINSTDLLYIPTIHSARSITSCKLHISYLDNLSSLLMIFDHSMGVT